MCYTFYLEIVNFVRIFSIIGIVTAFQAGYNLLSDNLASLYSGGNPCKLKHSLGVSFLIPCASFIKGTLCPPKPIFAVLDKPYFCSL